MSKKEVEITIFNRKGLGSHVETVEFVDMVTLKKRVDKLVEKVPFYKVIVELSPNWSVTENERKELDCIEKA